MPYSRCGCVSEPITDLRLCVKLEETHNCQAIRLTRPCRDRLTRKIRTQPGPKNLADQGHVALTQDVRLLWLRLTGAHQELNGKGRNFLDLAKEEGELST